MDDRKVPRPDGGEGPALNGNGEPHGLSAREAEVMEQSVYAIATMDTKGHELAYVAEALRASGVRVVMVDVGTLEQPTVVPDVDRSEVARCGAAASIEPAQLRASERG